MRLTTAIAIAIGAGAAAAAATPMPAKIEPMRREDGYAGRRPRSTHGHRPVSKRSSNSAPNVEYSGNWAGAIAHGKNITIAGGQFTVPTPKTPPGGSKSDEYWGVAWVGLDGDVDKCQSLLQTGIEFGIQNGVVTYNAWYEWYPADMQYFNRTLFPIKAGDLIQMTVYATSPTTGAVFLVNQSTGVCIDYIFPKHSYPPLCLTAADWIIEDMIETDGYQPGLADFGTVSFTKVNFETSLNDDDNFAPNGFSIVEMQTASGSVVTSCSLGNESVTCTYV